MKTKAEEILEKHGFIDGYSVYSSTKQIQESVLKAMEEYRQETIREAKELLLSQTLMTRLHVNFQPIEMIPMAVARDL